VPVADFTSWASPDLVLPLGGHTYTVRPPSVRGARRILACAIRIEHSVGVVTGPIPDELATLLEEIGGTLLEVVAFGQDVYDRMLDDELPAIEMQRAAIWTVIYWARGRTIADAYGTALWGEQSEAAGAGEPDPKGPPRRRSGRRTG